MALRRLAGLTLSLLSFASVRGAYGADAVTAQGASANEATGPSGPPASSIETPTSAAAADPPGAEPSSPAAPPPPPTTPSVPPAGATVTPELADRGSVESGRSQEETGKKRHRWHDSTLTLDQSVTTQTVGIGADYQSANSLYEWWVALRPNYYIYEDARQSLSVKGWANLYYELTNSDTTTYANEPSIGPTFITVPYARTLHQSNGYKTSGSIGARFILPTDKAARDTGQYVVLGASGGISERIPLRRGATLLDELRVGFEATYGHPITRATTPVNGGLQRPRQDLGGRTFVSDQLSPGTNVNHSLNLYFSGDLRITPALSWNVTYVLLNSWLYAPTDARVCTPTGCVSPQGIDDPTTFRPSTWTVTSLDFDPAPEVTLSLGYYNRATQLGPSGQRRSALWSPDARFFLSIIGKLDAIYDRLRSPSASTQVGQR